MKKFSKNKKYFLIVAIRLPQSQLEFGLQRMRSAVENEKYDGKKIALN